MDSLFDETREDSTIEDYLFSNYRYDSGAKDTEHQFAKPIQDEDLFAVEPLDQVPLDDEIIDEPYLGACDDDPIIESEPSARDSPEILGEKLNNSPTRLFDEEVVELERSGPVKQYKTTRQDIDEVFIDDYSESSYPNNENVQPKTVQDDIQAKKAQFLARLKEQARSLAIKPKRMKVDEVRADAMEFVIEQDRLVSDSQSKFIFNKIFNRSKKAHDTNGTPERKAKCWNDIHDSYRKRISNDKRKIWDSLNKKTDQLIDEEEEFFEEKRETSPDRDENKETADIAESDQELDRSDASVVSEDSQQSEDNFEDLEKEDRAAEELDSGESSSEDNVEPMEQVSEDEEELISRFKSDRRPAKNQSEKQPSLMDNDDELVTNELPSDDDVYSSEEEEKDQVESNSVRGPSESDDEDEDLAPCGYSLNLDDSDDSKDARIRTRHRQIYIDDEAED